MVNCTKALIYMEASLTELLSNGQTFSEIGTAVKMAQRYCERIGVENRR